MTHICVNEIIIIGSDNGLSPRRRQAIIWTNAKMLVIGPLGINFSEFLINTFPFKKMHVKLSSAKWRLFRLGLDELTHWGRETHICVGNLTIIGSDDGLTTDRRQAIILTNDGILLIGPLVTNFSEFLIVTHTFSFPKMHLKMPSAKWRLFGLGLNVLITTYHSCRR